MNESDQPEDHSKAFTIIIAEDDEDDYLLTKEAFIEAGAKNPLHWVKDGEELIQFLTNVSANEEETKHIGMILLDLNMPKKDGRESLKEIKNSPQWRMIPVLILTTSNADSDILNSYDLGVNSYIQKPVRFPELVAVAKSVVNYWFNTVKLPINNS